MTPEDWQRAWQRDESGLPPAPELVARGYTLLDTLRQMQGWRFAAPMFFVIGVMVLIGRRDLLAWMEAAGWAAIGTQGLLQGLTARRLVRLEPAPDMTLPAFYRQLLVKHHRGLMQFAVGTLIGAPLVLGPSIWRLSDNVVITAGVVAVAMILQLTFMRRRHRQFLSEMRDLERAA